MAGLMVFEGFALPFFAGLLCRSGADICAVRFVNFPWLFRGGAALPWASSTNDLFEI
jgi:hypothetical protein